MTDNGENVVIEMLKGLRNEVPTLRTEMHSEFGDLKQRMPAIECGIGGMKRGTPRSTTITPASKQPSTGWPHASNASSVGSNSAHDRAGGEFTA